MIPNEFYNLPDISENNDFIYKTEIMTNFVNDNTIDYNRYNDAEHRVKIIVKLEHYDHKYPVTYSMITLDNKPFGIMLESGKYGDTVSLYITDNILFLESIDYFKKFIEDDYSNITKIDADKEYPDLDICSDYVVHKTDGGARLMPRRFFVPITNKNDLCEWKMFLNSDKAEKMRTNELLPLIENMKIDESQDLRMIDDIRKKWISIVQSCVIGEDITIQDIYPIMKKSSIPHMNHMVKLLEILSFTINGKKFKLFNSDWYKPWSIDMFSVDNLKIRPVD